MTKAELEADNAKLRSIILQHMKGYFICGESGERDGNGLPPKIEICPAYGCDWSVMYERRA